MTERWAERDEDGGGDGRSVTTTKAAMARSNSGRSWINRDSNSKDRVTAVSTRAVSTVESRRDGSGK